MKIDNLKQNRKCRLCGDGDESINPIMREYSKLVQRNKTRHEWVRKMIKWDLCKNLKFNQTTKCYLHKQKFVPVNATCEQIDQLITAPRPELKIKKKNENLSYRGINSKKINQKMVNLIQWKINVKTFQFVISQRNSTYFQHPYLCQSCDFLKNTTWTIMSSFIVYIFSLFS